MGDSEGVAVWIGLELVAAVCPSVEVDGLIVKNFTRFELQIPQGSQIRYGEDELYEEMKDTCRQHSQLTAWYCPL